MKLGITAFMSLNCLFQFQCIELEQAGGHIFFTFGLHPALGCWLGSGSGFWKIGFQTQHLPITILKIIFVHLMKFGPLLGLFENRARAFSWFLLM